jgi:hypothetical protein
VKTFIKFKGKGRLEIKAKLKSTIYLTAKLTNEHFPVT